MKVICRFRTIESPIHGTFRGIRIEVAQPNLDGIGPTGRPSPSFAKPYYICCFGDYENHDAVANAWDKLTDALKEMGVTDVHFI